MKCILGMVALLLLAASCSNKKENTETSEELLEIIHRVNQRYQSMHKPQVRSFWDNAVYHTGNMEVCALTGNKDYLQYSIDWADYNQWKGATRTTKLSGEALMENHRNMFFLVIGKFVSKLMPIYINLTLIQ